MIFCPVYAPDVHANSMEQHITMVKFACLLMIAQKICHILHLFFLMSDKKRRSHSELVEAYPLEVDGDNDFNGNAFLIILQYLIGVTIFFVAFCLVHKRSRAALYLMPWLFTIGLMLELPLKPVLPENLIFVMSAVLMLQIYMLLCA